MAGQLTIDTLKASSGVLATQNGMSGIAKAWVNFVGGTGSINNSFNVSSVTRTATGAYTINFSTAMPTANYSMVAIGSIASGGYVVSTALPYNTTPSTTACSIISLYYPSGGTYYDPTYVSVTFHA
jgi:hypothetical protein